MKCFYALFYPTQTLYSHSIFTQQTYSTLALDVEYFDSVALHYSVRTPV